MEGEPGGLLHHSAGDYRHLFGISFGGWSLRSLDTWSAEDDTTKQTFHGSTQSNAAFDKILEAFPRATKSFLSSS